MVDVLPPVCAYPKWEVNGTATEGYITISVMQSGSVFVKQEMKSGAKTLLKTLQAISNTVSVKEEPMDEDDPDSANHSTAKPSSATSSTDQERKDSTHITEATCTSENNDGKTSQNREEVSFVGKKKFCIVRIKLEGVVAQCRKSPRKRRSRDDVRSPQGKGQRSVEISSDESDEQIEDLTLSGKATLNVGTSPVLAVKEDEGHREEVHDLPAAEKENFCKACDESFETGNQLIKHRREKHKGKQQCEMCDKVFSNRFLLTRHELQMHKRKQFQCPMCEKYYGSEKLLEGHINSCHPNSRLPCTICDKTFKTKASLKAHVSRHSDSRNVLCKICGKSFKLDGDLSLHMSNVHLNNGCKCEICGKQFRAKRTLEEHCIAKHDFRARYYCKTCGRGFVLKCKLDKHIKTHDENETGLVTVNNDSSHKGMGFLRDQNEINVEFGQATKTAENGNGALEGDHLDIIRNAPKCANNIPSKAVIEQIRAKYKLQRKMAVRKELREQCHKCGKLFANKFLVKRHDEQIHALKTHRCEVCNRSYGSEKMLQIHVHSSHGLSKFLCSLCGKHLKSKFSLEQHIARHTASKNVICNMCGKMFKFTTDLDIHMKRMHGDNLPVQCNMCGKTFRIKRSLDEHNIKMHNFQAPFNCSVCGRGFVIKCKLDRHMTSHTGDKPFQCGECGKTFAQKYYLTLHIDTHATEATHECVVCHKKFKTKKYLYNHMEIHNTSKPKVHQCNQCSMNFRNNQLLKRHYAIHLNERRFKCERCGKGFNSSGSLHHHRKTHSNEQFTPLLNVNVYQ